LQQKAQLLLASRRKTVERLEAMAGPTGRQSWPDAVKARIVAESFAPGARVVDVARQGPSTDRDRGGRGRRPARGRQFGGTGGRDRRGPARQRMIVPADAVRVVIATQPVDFRRGHDSLAALAQQQLGLDPHSGVIVVFRSKRGDRIKILVFDGTGLVEPCSQNLCEGARIAGCRQRRRAVGAGALEGDVPWKPATWPGQPRPGPRSPRRAGAGWPS
jgi:transposase